MPAPQQQPAQLAPVTSEMIAEQARIEVKPGEAHVEEPPPPAFEKSQPRTEKAAPQATPHRRRKKPRLRPERALHPSRDYAP